jgi:hypothetical protein
MTQQPFKPLFLDLLRQAQTDQNAFFQQLSVDEQEASGTPDLWSAKDHVAHMTFWRQRLALRLQALIRQEPQPETQDFVEMNPLIFAEQRYRPWTTILAESDATHAELCALTEQLTEEDLTTWGRFEWMNDGWPLYTSFMGNCCEHLLIHMAQYLSDRQEDVRAIEVYESGARKIITANVPAFLQSLLLYNLSCFYATHNQLEKARPTLEQSFSLYPRFREFARTDPDLAAFHADLP